MKDLKKKAILMLVSGILLVSVLLYSSFAWYTKMTSVHGLTFTLAKWDFNANYQEDNFVVNVYEYSQITSQKAAPGTRGFIPLSLSASRSDASVEYSITVDTSTMSPEFQKRIYFYYLNENQVEVELIAEGEDKTSLSGTIAKSSTEVVNVYWHWLYDYDEYLERTSPDEYAVVEILNLLNETNEENADRLIDNLSDALGSAGNTGKDRVLITNATETFALTTTESNDLQSYINTYGGDNFSLRSFWTDYCLDDTIYNAPENATQAEIAEATAAAKVISIIKRVANENNENTEILFSNTTSAINGNSIFWLNLKTSLTATERETILNYITTHATNNVLLSLRDFYEAYTEDPESFDAPADPTTEQIKDAENADAVYTALQRIKALDPYNLEILFANTTTALTGDDTEIFWAKTNTYALTNTQKTVINDFITNRTVGDSTFTFKGFWQTYLESYETYDEFDTEAGTNLDLYQPLMNANLSIVGVEASLATSTK